MDLVFIVNAGPGTAHRMECQTGKIRWTERLDGGESQFGRDGSRAVVCHEPKRRHHRFLGRILKGLNQLAQNDLGESSNATPAISDGDIFTDSHLYCVTEE